MYKSFRVKNFRCFKDLQISDLGRVNLIAGKNNTGKTALMEAIYIHSGNRETETLLRSRSGSYRESASIMTWSTIFSNFDTNNTIEMSAKLVKQKPRSLKDRSTYNLRLTCVEDLEIESEKFGKTLLSIINEIKSEPDILRIESNSDSKSVDYMLSNDWKWETLHGNEEGLFPRNFLYARKKVRINDNATRFSILRQSIGISILTNSLKTVEPRLKSLELLIDGNRPLIHADIGLSKLISLTSLGDGMNRMASLILAMVQAGNGVIFIDEIENGIHHSVQTDVWKAIGHVARELDIQVFATTHSLEMVRAAYEAFAEAGKLEEFRFHRLYRSRKTNDINATTYNELDMEAVAAFDFDHEVR